jgi:hypothetical protein
VTIPIILIAFRRAHFYLEFIVQRLKITVISETCKNSSTYFKNNREKGSFFRPETT